MRRHNRVAQVGRGGVEGDGADRDVGFLGYPAEAVRQAARGRYEVSYFALKRASPTEQPRELIDRISMSAPSSAQPPIN